MAEIVSMPKLGFDMAEGLLTRWVKAEGETVNKGDVLAEIETDKATVEVESTFSGVVFRHVVPQGTSVPVGEPIAVIADAGEKVDEAALGLSGAPKAAATTPKEEAPAAAANIPAPAAVSVPAGEMKASPIAKRIARESNLDLSKVSGTGPDGRIVRKDVEEYLSSAKVAVVSPAAPVSAPAAAPAAALPLVIPTGMIPEDKVIPVERLRAAIGRRMVESKTQLPHFYVSHTYKAEALMQMRKEVNELVVDDQKLSVNDFIIKAAALALRQYPNLNSALKGDTIVRYGHINIGVAVAVPGGLMTVVVRDADQKPIRAISVEVKAMVARARSGKVRPEDIEGSTFSISNLGMYDVDSFIAIINPPEAAILAVGSIQQVAVVENGVVTSGQRMTAAISADHRITDGAEAAQFMQALAVYLERPMRLLI